jgi:hypothetical protein
MNPVAGTISARIGQALLSLALPFSIATGRAETPATTGHGSPDQWFGSPGIHQIQVDVPPESVAALRKDARNYVRATVTEGTERLTDVGLRVKGRTGSFRTIDEKASLTLTFDHFIHGQRLYGFRKIHLNNSVEDPTYLHEKLGTEMFVAAGVKAPWVCHAIVTLNGRRLGLYVVKEGFAPEFFARSFGRGDGDTFEPEPGPGCDVDGPMKRDPGTAANHRNELSKLAEAVRITDLTARWEGLRTIMDTETFVKFLAMEALLGHRDGYGQARNNYRLYQDPISGRFNFIPSGMDHLLGNAEATLYPRFSGLVAKAACETPAGRTAYREQLGLLFTNVVQREAWTNRIAAWGSALSRDPALSHSESQSIQVETADLCHRFQARAVSIERALAQPERMPLRFEQGSSKLGGWEPRDSPAGGRMERVPIDGRNTLSIVAGPRTSASWRTSGLLEAGRYRFEGEVRTRGVVALADGRFHGARLMINGPNAAPARSITGDNEWTLLQVEVEIGEGPSQLEFMCSLRAAAGQAWFDVDSLRIVRVSKDGSP